MRHPTVKWTIATLAAVGLAAAGVVLYARWPGVATSQAHIFLVGPLLGLVMYGLHRCLPLRLQWSIAWALLALGAGAYLLWPNDQSWQYGSLACMPLLVLGGLSQASANGEDQEPAYGGGFDGPWGPPA